MQKDLRGDVYGQPASPKSTDATHNLCGKVKVGQTLPLVDAKRNLRWRSAYTSKLAASLAVSVLVLETTSIKLPERTQGGIASDGTSSVPK